MKIRLVNVNPNSHWPYACTLQLEHDERIQSYLLTKNQKYTCALHECDERVLLPEFKEYTFNTIGYRFAQNTFITNDEWIATLLSTFSINLFTKFKKIPFPISSNLVFTTLKAA